jgi:uncharacterized membrane protein YccC
MVKIKPASVIFSANCFIAALLALWIAFSIGLPRPYWAMLTVYITAQPLTGALRSKALFRVLGTALGGAAAVVIVPTFVNAPPLMALVMAGWVGFCLYLSLLDRTPRAYVFMLAGYTAAIIGFPSVTAPQAIFETALARVEEITVGIVCATLVHTIVFPRDVGRVLTARIAGFLKDSQAWMADALAGHRSGAGPRERRQLAADITELHIAATHLPFDTAQLPLRAGTVRALESRLAYMVPLISALEDRLAQLGRRGKALSRLLDDVAAWAVAWAGAGRDAEQAARLRERCRALTPAIGARSHWKTLLTVSILVRLEELIQALQDSRDLADVASGDRREIDGRLKTLLREPQKRRLHLDHGMAALSGLALMIAVLACCTLWIATAWPEGAVAAMMAGVFSAFFAAQDDPAPALGTLLIWIVLGIPAAALYLFLILPMIDGFAMLALALAPALLTIGYFMASPRWGLPAMAMLLGFAGGLALEANFSADLPSFLNVNLAQVAGIGAAIGATRLVRSVGAEWAARRIQRQGWRDIVALARSRRPGDADLWTSLMLDRVGLVAARAALAEPTAGIDTGGAVADMRIGLNLIDLEALTRRTDAAQAQAVARTLEGVAEVFERRLAAGTADPADPALLQSIDGAIAGLAARGDPDPRQAGFAALVGLRRNLFPTAPPYQAIAA